MTLRTIVRLGDPVLRLAAEPVKIEQESAVVEQIAEDMVETMRDANGVGISAPQIHETKRIIAIEVRPDNRYGITDLVALRVIVNPELDVISSRKAVHWEGCLSLPGLRGPVTRHQDVIVRGLDVNGDPFEEEFRDFAAVVVQHEIDHVDGVLFIDRMENLTLLSFEDEYERRQSELQGHAPSPLDPKSDEP
jgi:peptide deformylase